jgi:hypothetical protein
MERCTVRLLIFPVAPRMLHAAVFSPNSAASALNSLVACLFVMIAPTSPLVLDAPLLLSASIA